MLMKKQFLSKSVPRGTRTIWRYLGALFILFTFAIGNVWAAYDVPADGTVTLSQKVNNGGRFNVEASGVYHFRTSSGYSWDSSNGIKTQSNEGGVVFYLDASKEIEVGIVHTEAKNAHEVTVHVYSITESVYKQFDDNKAGAAESNRTFSTAPTSSTDGSFTISITAESKTFTGKKTLAAGYYAVVPVGEKSKTFFKTIKFTTTGGGTDVCPSGISITGEDEYTEGEKIELTAALTAGNGDISYQWYKGSVAPANAISGATKAKYEVASCTTANAGDYFCVASKDDCSDAVNASAFSITVAADTKCFNMPAITSKPADLASVVVTGGTLSDVSTAKSVAMNANGLKLDGNSVYLKVTLADASIIAGTKITVAWKGAGSGAGIAVVNGDLAEKVIDETNVEAAGSATHTFTAAEAANYADEFIIHRNASGTGIYVNAITVEDCGPAVTKHTITLNYNEGATPDGTLKVVDGNAAVKPADPTRGKYTFLGWFVGDTDNEYVWSTTVTGDITLKAHWQDPWTLTFDADGGSEVADVTVKHNTKAEKPADPTKDDNDFLGWFYGDPAVAFDWDANVTQNYALVAHWQLAVAKYDVEYYDGETKIGTEEQVWATGHPTATGIDTDKPLYTFVGWYLTSALEGDPVNLNTVTPVEGLKIYGKWAKAYATSVDLKAAATGSDEYTDVLDAHNIAYELTNTSWDDGTDIYNGLKIKGVNSYIKFNLKKGQLLMMTVGYAKNDVKIEVNDVDQSFVSSTTELSNFIYYAESSDVVITVTKTANQGTASSIRSITIRAPYQVSFDANGGDDVVAPQFATPSVTLPSASKGTDSFVGWFDGETKVGEAGDTYTPTANIELVAHWEAVSTDARLASITFSATGTLSPAFDPEVTIYTYTMPYGTAAIPTITGATSVSNKAQDPIIGDAAAAWGDAQTVKGVAQSGDKKTYTITMVKAPKDGVCIVKADLAAGSSAASITATSGAYKDADNIAINVAKDLKLGSTGAYVKVAVKDTYFQDGDVVEIVLRTDKSASAWLQIFADEGTTLVAEMKSGVSNATPNHLTISGVPENTSALYLYRTEAADGNMNPYPTSMAVYRAMNPVLTAITIDERAGVIDPLDDKHFNVQIPYEADLANLTIVPTIAWNAPAVEGSIVVNNGGAWVEGNNTYKLTDKDGDYTVYTLTLTRDVLKHTVSFNTHGGSAVASVEVVDGQKLAAAPADPTKDENVFKFWSETEDGAEVDVTTVQINADKEFHAVWEAEPAGIKLINGDVVNHTNFLTGTNETTVEIESVEHKCVDFTTAGSNRTTVASISDLKEFIQYNATTNKAKIKLTLYNTKSSAVSAYLHMLEEGSETPTTEEISIPAGEVLKTDFYEFNSEKNRSFYITCGNRDYVKVLQVKVIDDGTTTLKKAGQVGYSVKTLKSRIFAPQQSAISFEGLTINANAVCKPLSTTAMKIKNNYNISFHADAAMTLAVTTEGNQTYYVSATADGTMNETSFTGRKEFEITAGDWYIHAGNSELKVAKLEFIAPKCEKPTVADMDDVDLCEGAAFTALAVSASVSDEGTLHYAWFKEAGETDEAVGTDQATYTPAADGQYYVIVTNHKDNFTDNSKTSNTITVEHFAAAVIMTAPVDVMKEAGQSATLSVVASGKNCTYEWFACDDALGTNPVAFIPAETGTSLTVTVAGEKYYKVEVSSDCGAPVSAVAKVKEWTAYPQADVTGSITWDWTNAAWPAEGTASFKVVDGELDLLANQNSIVPVVDGVNGFRADMLLGSGQYVWRSGGADKKCFQGTELKFHTTVAGTVTLWYRSTSSGKDVKVYINGNDAGHHSTGNYTKSSTIVVPANSDVRITKEGETYVRINKIVFNANPDYTRPVSNNIGTLCVDHNVLAGGALGATFYQIASRNEVYNDKIDFEEVLPNEELKAGEPYIFKSTTGKIELFYGATVADAPVAVRGMIGSFVDAHVDITSENMSDILYIANNRLWNCEDMVGNYLDVVANRAYIVMSDVPEYSAPQQNSAPRRRVTLGKDATQTTTGVDNLNASEQPVKLLINGQIFILRGEKLFDVTGKLVK